MGAFWQQAEKITVPAVGTATFSLKRNSPLERLTIWAISDRRVIANLSLQVQVNGQAYNPPIVIVGVRAADVIYRSGGAVAENDMIPYVPAGRTPAVDPFVFDVVLTNADAVEVAITMFAIGVYHQG